MFVILLLVILFSSSLLRVTTVDSDSGPHSAGNIPVCHAGSARRQGSACFSPLPVNPDGVSARMVS
ncbi:hypothetical protein LF934_18475 [Dickeya dadantii]|uniref:hypothetical protein n=1 Tax=Dickeya dadantii TaxID=204038 RepID=UPI001CF55412|nr:hypothetical protein [Dickeya dadantii]MCA7014623.1 hypothetical protein [Dickeya dadantii]